jgi:hypothetical protein
MQEQAPLHEQEVGVITHFWSKIGVAGVHLEAPVDIGDHIHVHGHSDDFEQNLESIEVEHTPIAHADAGADIGIRMNAPVHKHDRVFKTVAS